MLTQNDTVMRPYNSDFDSCRPFTVRPSVRFSKSKIEVQLLVFKRLLKAVSIEESKYFQFRITKAVKLTFFLK